MLGAAGALQSLGGWAFTVDATVSRHLYQSFGALSSAAGTQPDVVVVHLGTNSPFSDGQFDQVMQTLAGVPRVIWVNIQLPDSYTHEPQVNDVIARGVSRWGATLVDWHGATNGRPDLFSGDGFHSNGAGLSLYASLIGTALG